MIFTDEMVEQVSDNASSERRQPKSHFGNTQVFSRFEANAKTLLLPAYLTVNGILKKEVSTCIYNEIWKVKV